MRKILSAVLALVLVISMMGTPAFAAEGGSSTLTASLECYMPAMGGCDLAENIVESATYVDNADGSAAITLRFNEVGEWSSAYFSGQTTYVEAAGEIAYHNGSQWVNASYTTGTATDAEGNDYTYISSMTFTVSEKVNTYDLAMCMSGYQFGGSDPSAVSSGEKMTATLTVTWPGESTGSAESTDSEPEKQPEADAVTSSTPSVPEDSTTLTSSKYSVDISWTPMASMFSPVLEIDADDMTFNLYNKTAPETSKGAGTVTYADGVYTLAYDNGNTTTFTCEDGVISFTSKLWYGAASFDQTDDNGNFIPYIAVLIAEETTESDAADNSESTGDSEASEVISPEDPKPEEETTPEETKPETAEPPKSTVISVSSLKDLAPGTYKLTADLDCYMSAMGGCQFGGVLRSTHLVVDENRSASIKLYFYGDAELTMMYGSITICVNPSMETSYWNGSQWVKASYNTATATDDEGSEYTYVSSMTIPVSKVEDTYKLGLGFGGGSMGAQFGGESAQMLSDGSVLNATLSVDWAKTHTNPATGDENTVVPYVLMMVLAASGIAVLVTMKKRKMI